MMANRKPWRINVPTLQCIPEEFRPPVDKKERTKWWNGLSQKKKRVAVAYDVLHQLDAGVYKAKRGLYWRWSGNSLYDRTLRLLVEKLGNQEKLENSCEVCAIGSGVLSAFALGDPDRKGELEPTTVVGYGEDSPVNPIVHDVFSHREWRQMEQFFESWSRWGDKQSLWEMSADGTMKQGATAEVALRGLFTSIIEHGGSLEKVMTKGPKP